MIIQISIDNTYTNKVQKLHCPCVPGLNEIDMIWEEKKIMLTINQ